MPPYKKGRKTNFGKMKRIVHRRIKSDKIKDVVNYENDTTKFSYIDPHRYPEIQEPIQITMDTPYSKRGYEMEKKGNIELNEIVNAAKTLELMRSKKKQTKTGGKSRSKYLNRSTRKNRK